MSKAEPRVQISSPRDDAKPLDNVNQDVDESHNTKSLLVEAWRNLHFFFRPMPLLLCLGACFRHTGRVVANVNTNKLYLRLFARWIYLGVQQSALL